MRTVSISWDKVGSRFTGVGAHPAHVIDINAPRPDDARGESTGFSPAELLLAAAGSCSGWDVVEILRKRRANLTGLEITVEGKQAADPPWQYEQVALHYRLTADGLTLPVVARVVRLSVVRYCSVVATIAAAAAISATVELIDSAGNSSGVRTIELAIPYQPHEADMSDDLALVGVPEPIVDEAAQ